MKNSNFGYFLYRLHTQKKQIPLYGHFELTYRCNFDCLHCCCKGSEDKGRELTTVEIKKNIDEIYQAGCLRLTLSGGEPLVRKDFWEIYAYAKAKGFLINLFTNGQLLTRTMIQFLVKFPPASIEITFNGISKKTYESITQVKGSFLKIMHTIKMLAKTKLPVILKTNCLKQNKNEIGEIKSFTEKTFGKASLPGRYRFKYDPMIYPRFNGDKTPCNYRLSFSELRELKKQDQDIWQEYQKGLHGRLPDFRRDKDFLYQCDSWMKQFFIDPFGNLKFCPYSDKFSVNLRKNSFKAGFYKEFPKLLKERFKTDSKCKDCSLRTLCHHCPGRAFLETGDEEAPVEYYCQLAQEFHKELSSVKGK